MTLQPLEGILEVVAKVADVDQDAAVVLVRLGLYESLADQIDAMAPRLAVDQAELVHKRVAIARRTLDAQVGKADQDDLERQHDYLDLIEAHADLVEKGVLDWFGWNQKNPEHPRNARGEWVGSNKFPAAAPAYDVMSGVVGGRGASRLAYALPTNKEGVKNLDAQGRAWNDEGDGPRARGYKRLTMTGNALAAISAPGSPGHVVGGMASLVGNLGPEAEKVLGPGIQRTAYRYRGTERRPDTALLREISLANAALRPLTDANQAGVDQLLAGHRDRAIAGTKGDPVAGVLGHYAQSRHLSLSGDQLEMRVRGDIAVAALIDDPTFPDPKLAGISMEAGEVPPSQGVIIDADGQVASQAVGYTGDHYLPFDLKNLRALDGGQYARTRVAGGPTSEDIYTGLMTNARQIQVVSNTGVFTVEFDPDLRGGRRYSDKARKMVRRYEDLLHTVDSGGLYRQDVDQAEQAKLRRTAYEVAGWDKEQGEANFKAMLDQARLKDSLGVEDEDLEADARIKAAEQLTQYTASSGYQPTRAQVAGAYDDAYDELRKEKLETAVRRYRLDGEGYAAALGALKQEFPYYIRAVHYEPLTKTGDDPGFFRERGLPPRRRFDRPGADKGHLRRGELKANVGGAHLKRPTRTTSTEAPAATEAPGGELRQTAPVSQTGPGSVHQPGETKVKVPGARISVPITRTEPLAATLAPGTEEFRDFAAAVNQAVFPFQAVNVLPSTVGLGLDDTQADKLPAGQFMDYALGNHRQDLAAYLLAKPVRLENFETMLNTASSLYRNPDDAAALEGSLTKEDHAAAVDKVSRAIAMQTPFAPMGPEGLLAMPDMDDPKPLAIPEIVALGRDKENYDVWLRAAKALPAGRDIHDMVYELEDAGSTPDARARRVGSFVKRAKDHPEERLAQLNAEDAQYAWAFLHARELRDAVPFDPAAEPRVAKAASESSPFDQALTRARAALVPE